ncbi:MAG: hypothetical protein K2Q21_14695 [Chitinophagaceae bacterium]|nr:hypothetical protein [Chitinophagaceae bacterium]
MHGFLPGKIYLLAGCESVGKTAFLLNLLVNMNSQIQEKRRVILYTPGMSASLVTQKIISCITEIHIDKISRGKLQQEEFKQFNALLMEHFSIGFSICLIIDQPNLSVKDLFNHQTKSQESERPEIIMIDDFLLLHSDKNGNSNERIAEIMIDLKELAEKFQIPVLLSSRLVKKDIELSRLSDLRISGIPEQLVDIVFFIENPVYYEVMSSTPSFEIKGEKHIRIAKNKFGIQGSVRFKAQLSIQKFNEIEESTFWIRGDENRSDNEE